MNENDNESVNDDDGEDKDEDYYIIKQTIISKQLTKQNHLKNK